MSQVSRTISWRPTRVTKAPLVLLLACVMLTACSKPRPVVVLDGWWNVDYAKEACRSARTWVTNNATAVAQVGCDRYVSCREMTRRNDACVPDNTGGVREFQVALGTQVATLAQCHDIRFIHFDSPTGTSNTSSDALRGAHWALTLDFVPGATKQPWTLIGPAMEKTAGEDTVAQIAAKVCAIAEHRGGELQN
jgi:hypothetical protein